MTRPDILTLAFLALAAYWLAGDRSTPSNEAAAVAAIAKATGAQP